MKPLRFLTAQHIQLLHFMHITPLAFRQLSRVCDPGYVESAASSPQNHQRYNGVDDPFELAALLAERVALNHAFRDGNKRTALYAADVFLRMNGGRGLLADDEPRGEGISQQGRALADAMVHTATRQLSAEELAAVYRTGENPP